MLSRCRVYLCASWLVSAPDSFLFCVLCGPTYMCLQNFFFSFFFCYLKIFHLLLKGYVMNEILFCFFVFPVHACFPMINRSRWPKRLWSPFSNNCDWRGCWERCASVCLYQTREEKKKKLGDSWMTLEKQQRRNWMANEVRQVIWQRGESKRLVSHWRAGWRKRKVFLEAKKRWRAPEIFKKKKLHSLKCWLGGKHS